MMKIANYLWVGILLLTGAGFSQEVAKKTSKEIPLEDPEEPPSWDVTCEVFSLPLSEAAKLKRARKTDAQDYTELVKRVETGKAVQEEFLMLRTVERASTISEEISEMIYATEFEPPEQPNEIDNLLKDIEMAKMLVTPATPTSFDTKKVGSILEVKLETIGKDEIEFESTLTFVDYLGRQVWGQETAETEMPRFTVQRVHTSLKMDLDSATLMGSISPPEALQPKEGEKRVWLAFVTVSKSKD